MSEGLGESAHAQELGILLQHYFCGLYHRRNGVPDFQVHFFRAPARDNTFDEVLADSDDHVRHHVSKLKFLDLANQMIACGKAHRAMIPGERKPVESAEFWLTQIQRTEDYAFAFATREDHPMSDKSFYGWKLLVILWLIIFLNFTFPTFGTSVVNTYMAKAMNLNRKELGLAFSAFSLMAGLPGPLVAMSINKLGIRFTLVAGALLSALGCLLMAIFVQTTVQAILIFGVVVGAGVAMAGTMAPQVAMARWFRQRRARAISLLLSASAFGGFVSVPFLNHIIAAYGTWRAAWWCMALMSLLAGLVAAIFVRESPAQMGQVPDGEVDARIGSPGSPARPSAARKLPNGVFKTGEDWTLSEALRSPKLWLLVPTYLGFFMGFFIYIAHGISHLEGLGHTPAQAARSISVVLLSSLIGQFAVAALGDRIEPRYLSAVAVSFYGAGTLLAIHAVDPVTVYVYAILMGSGFGAAFTCFQTILSNYYGTKVYPALLGITMPAGTILAACGPVTAGYLYDRYGTYAPAFEIVAVLCFASAILYLLAVPPVKHSARAKIEPARQAT
jgi:MFS family permease